MLCLIASYLEIPDLVPRDLPDLSPRDLGPLATFWPIEVRSYEGVGEFSGDQIRVKKGLHVGACRVSTGCTVFSEMQFSRPWLIWLMETPERASEFFYLDDSGKKCDANLLEPILDNPEANIFADSSVIKRAMDRGMSLEDAASLYAGPETLEWLKSGGRIS